MTDRRRGGAGSRGRSGVEKRVRLVERTRHVAAVLLVADAFELYLRRDGVAVDAHDAADVEAGERLLRLRQVRRRLCPLVFVFRASTTTSNPGDIRPNASTASRVPRWASSEYRPDIVIVSRSFASSTVNSRILPDSERPGRSSLSEYRN